MDRLHDLLKSQLEGHFGELSEVPLSLKPFLDEVHATYEKLDKERHALEQSLGQSFRELRRANWEMRAVFKAFPDLFLWVDEAGTIIDIHAGDEEDLYLPEVKLLGRRIGDFPVADVGRRFERAVERVRSNSDLAQFEYIYEKDGIERTYEARVLSLFRDQVLVIIRNITERKRAEAALAAEKEQLAVTLRSIGDGVITANGRGEVVMMNQVAEKLTGWAQSEALGRPLEEVLELVVGGDQGGQPMPFQNTDTVNTSGVLISRDGAERTISSSLAPIRDRHARMVGVVLVFRDITEDRRREEQRVRSTKLASISILAGGIAHDFNNFLTAILGNISLARLQLAEEGHKTTELLARSEIAARQARELTQQLLTFSMGDSPAKKIVSARKLIEECASFALRGSNETCEVSIDDQLDLVEVDKGQITQVIHNLIINADQAMPEGGTIEIRAKNVTLEVMEVASLKPGSYVAISVTDTGVGIGPSHLARIFDPYFTTKAEGSGLGLATAYSIVRNHQGLIQVASEAGSGATFTVFLPAATGEEEEEEEWEDDVTFDAVESGRVLVMDDDRAVLAVTREMLLSMGYEVLCATEGEQMVELYRGARDEGNPFDIVIMDLTVPGGMGGEEAIARLLAIDPKARVIVSSGYSDDPILGDFASHGFRAVLRKPFDFKDLSQVLDEIRRRPVKSGEEAP